MTELYEIPTSHPCLFYKMQHILLFLSILLNFKSQEIRFSRPTEDPSAQVSRKES